MVIKGDNWKLVDGQDIRVRKQGQADRTAARVQEEKRSPPASVTTIEKMVAARVAPQAPTEPQQPPPQVAKPDASAPVKESADPAKPPDAATPRLEVVQRGTAEKRPETRGDALRDQHRRFSELTRGPMMTTATTPAAAATLRPVTAVPPSPEVHVGPRPSDPPLALRTETAAPREAPRVQVRDATPIPLTRTELPAAGEKTRTEKKEGGEKKETSSSGDTRRSAGAQVAGGARGGDLHALDAGVSADAGGNGDDKLSTHASLIVLNPDGEEALQASQLKATYFSFVGKLQRLPLPLQKRLAVISREAAELDRGIVGLYGRILSDDEELKKALFSAFLNGDIYG